MAKNKIKVRKPYDKIINDCINNNNSLIDTRKPKGFPAWMYMLQLQKRGLPIKTQPLGGRYGSIFQVNPTGEIKIEKEFVNYSRYTVNKRRKRNPFL